MRRVILLALLALAVPVASFATTTGINDYSNGGVIGTAASATGSATTSIDHQFRTYRHQQHIWKTGEQ